jgi:hypothetical protein
MHPVRGLVMLGVVLAIGATGCGGTRQTATVTTTETVTRTASVPATTTTRATAKPPTRRLGAAATAYAAAMQPLGKRLGRTVQQLYTLATGTAGSAVRTSTLAELAKARAAFADIAARLAELVPPRDVQAQHRRLVAAVRSIGDEVGGMIESLKANNLRQFVALSHLEALKNVQANTRAIVVKGYPIG